MVRFTGLFQVLLHDIQLEQFRDGTRIQSGAFLFGFSIEFLWWKCSIQIDYIKMLIILVGRIKNWILKVIAHRFCIVLYFILDSVVHYFTLTTTIAVWLTIGRTNIDNLKQRNQRYWSKIR